MKAAIIDALGQLPRFGDFAEPLAEGDEIVVTVTAASIKQLDRAIAAGTHYSSPRELPVIPGTDGVGRLPDGAQVYFAANRRPFGGMAELAPASWTVPLPVGMDNALAAAIVNPALGAWLPIMWRGGLRPGETGCGAGCDGWHRAPRCPRGTPTRRGPGGRGGASVGTAGGARHGFNN